MPEFKVGMPESIRTKNVKDMSYQDSDEDIATVEEDDKDFVIDDECSNPDLDKEFH